jgi:hypothetical protein
MITAELDNFCASFAAVAVVAPVARIVARISVENILEISLLSFSRP